MSAPSSSNSTPTPRHALTAVEKQRAQLERLLRDPSKPAYIPAPPKEKTIRPAREMMKNVQGSSAGAGSGEFHVYKAGRRREYERLKLMEEQAQNEVLVNEFERKRKAAEEVAEAKTAKNRAKRQKKKEKAKVNRTKSEEGTGDAPAGGTDASEWSLKKRRLVNGKELVFRKPGEESDEEIEDSPPLELSKEQEPRETSLVVEEPKITIHEDD